MLTILIGVFFLGKTFEKKLLLAMLLSYGGILIAFVHDLGRLTADSHSVLIGGSLVFGCAITYAIYNAGAEVAIERMGGNPVFNAGAAGVNCGNRVRTATRPVAALNLPWQVSPCIAQAWRYFPR